MPPHKGMLSVVHLCTSDTGGGAAIAALRLCRAQQKSGLDARMLVLHKRGSEEFVSEALEGKLLGAQRAKSKFWGEILLSATANGFHRGHRLFTVSIPYFGVNVADHPLVRAADIIHLHWVNQGFISLRSLRQLAETKKKVLWTLHDLWPITAICHHTSNTKDRDFEKETPGCDTLLARAFAQRVFDSKQQIYRTLKPTFVGCSQWIASVARQSRLTKGCLVEQIPNIPDIEQFHPYPRDEARKRLGLSSERPIILYGAANANDERKGYRQMVEAVSQFSTTHTAKRLNPLLLVFGKASPALFSREKLGLEAKLVGYIAGSEQMALHYAAANFFLTTSLEENLPNTIIESQLCNRPSVAFAIGGIPEIITSPTEGALVNPFETEKIAFSIEQMLLATEENEPHDLRTDALKRYNEADIIADYSNLYATLFQRSLKEGSRLAEKQIDSLSPK